MIDAKIRSFRDLIMWQKAKDFSVQIYKTTRAFPKEETYGLASQLRRASVSIASNIAEGFHRRSAKEKLQFLRMAYGSGAEIETQLEIAKELSYIPPEVHRDLSGKLAEVMKIINTVLSKL